MEKYLLVIYTHEWEFHTFVNIHDARIFEADMRKAGKLHKVSHIYQEVETIYS